MDRVVTGSGRVSQKVLEDAANGGWIMGKRIAKCKPVESGSAKIRYKLAGSLLLLLLGGGRWGEIADPRDHERQAR